MLSYASAYKMCVPTLSKLLNATARSRRAGPRACRLPDQLAWETLPGSAREGVSSYYHDAVASQFDSDLLDQPDLGPKSVPAPEQIGILVGEICYNLRASLD